MWVPGPVVPLTCCVALNKSLNFLESPLSHFHNENNVASIRLQLGKGQGDCLVGQREEEQEVVKPPLISERQTPFLWHLQCANHLVRGVCWVGFSLLPFFRKEN